jgi:hypothetical protein
MRVEEMTHPSGTHTQALPPELHDCVVLQEDVAGRQLLRIVDAQARTLGCGLNLERAVQMAIRSRQSRAHTPERYSPRLAGCSFQRESHSTLSPPSPGAARVLVLDSYGRVLAAHADAAAACRDAEREVLRYQPADSLALDDFAKLCTTLTVQVVRGASGKAKRGEPRLQHLDSLAGLREALARQYRRRAPEFGQEPHHCAVPLDVLNARTEAFLAEHGFDSQARQVHPVDLDGEFIVLRTREAPEPRRCIAMAHDYLIALAQELRLDQAQAQCAQTTQALRALRQRG